MSGSPPRRDLPRGGKPLSPSNPLPPPPQVAPAAPRSSNTPHISTAPIQVLESAPPSANLPDVSSSTLPAAATMTLPPPPPPPPPRQSALSGMSSATGATATSVTPGSRVAPSFTPATTNLPPPPPMGTANTSAPRPAPPPATTEPLQRPSKLPHTTFTSPELSILAQRQTHIPILLIATETAHSLAHKNQLLLEDMMQGMMESMLASHSHTATTSPIAVQQSSHPLAPFRSVTKTLYLTWKDIHVSFSCAPPDNSTDEDDENLRDLQAAQLLQQQAALQDTDGNLNQELFLLEDQIDNLLQETTEQKEQVHKDAFALTSPLNIPWLWRYRQALDVTTNNLPHELLDCPPVILLVCTTQEVTNPLETLRSLMALPPVRQFRNGLWDRRAVRYEALVLHDNVTGPRNWDEAGLVQDLRSNFGAAAAVLRINSVPPQQAVLLAQEERSDVWKCGGKAGNCLSMNDRVALKQYLQNLVTQSVLPALERRVAELNTSVSERKKGVRNVLKSFWRTGKTKEDDDGVVAAASDGVLYRFDSIENQTRLLGDTLFLLKDYEAALGMYRLIKDDFKQDKAHAEYGSVQEMMALCLYFTDPFGRAREIYSHIENALLSYSRAAEAERGRDEWGQKPGRIPAAPKSTRLATRLCLVLMSTKNICSDRHLEVADLLASVSSNESSLGAAVLLEQASAHYFHAEMYRKYAFHMLMSGHMFRSAEQDNHAFRCFVSALHLYREGRWEELHNHLRSALAAQLYSMGRMAIALQLYAKLVGSENGGRVSVKSQQKFVNHLLEICNEHPKKALAAADRLAASAKLSGADRDAVRKDKLDRIVQVVRYTKSASRVLELPNVDLPLIDDSSVVVVAEEASHHRQESVPGFGDARVGTEDVWEEMMLATVAELRAAAETKAKVDDEVTYNALKKINDAGIRKVVAEMDKERSNQALKQRTMKSANYKPKPPSRALMEPYFIEFSVSNPLHIPIDMSDMQLVAKMTQKDTEKECTNEDAVKITPLVSFDKENSWRFQSCDAEFTSPDFCRISADGESGRKRTWKSAEEVTPFFVVTKSSFTLDAESKKSVSLGICPLEQGRMEILGVRFRLFDDVWLYHPFDIRGELLQNSRQNRAHRVRSESMLLKAKVENGMPCLTANLIAGESDETAVLSEATPMLQGQIRSWTLRVENIGTAVAGEVCLKINLPWASIRVTPEPSSAGATSTCIGPSGTLFDLPLRSDSQTKTLKLDGQLQPGESIDFDIDIRGSGTGKQEFYMLFRYALVGDAMDSENRRFRWLRKMFEVPIYPSLSLTATLTPSYQKQGEHILSTELTNFRTDRPDSLELVLEKACLASWLYGLDQLGGQLVAEEDSRIGWQERTTLHYKVRQKDATPSLVSESLCSAVQAEKRLPSILTFLCLERAHEQFMEILAEHKIALIRAAAAHSAENEHPRSISSIRRANTESSQALSGEEAAFWGSDDDIHPTSVDRLCPRTKDESEAVHLIYTWRSLDGSIRGQHHIRDLHVRPKELQRGCPITVTAVHSTEIAKNLSDGPATVPLSITLRNRLVQSSVAFDFALVRSEGFDFSGMECFSAELAGGEELKVRLQALIPSAGVYNLQRVRLTVRRGDMVSYLFPLQWLVSVKDIP